jgi:DnaD/phage-associated family protein
MQFIKGKTSIDIEDTPVENIFLDAFMPSADGNCLKVYLLGYKYACSRDQSKVFSNESIARALDIPVSAVLKAWDYWESKGIIMKHYRKDGEPDFSVEFLSLKQLYMDDYRRAAAGSPEGHRNSYSPTDLTQALRDESIRDMFNSIQKIVCRPLTPTESLLCLEWLYDLKMAPEVIEEAFRYSVEKRGVKNIRYINTIINNWYDNNINSINRLKEYLEATDAKYSRYNAVMKAMGRTKSLTRIEKEYMDKWFDVYGMPVDVILKACDIAIIQTPNPSLNYIDGILAKWHKENVKTVSDIPTDKKEAKQPKRKGAKNKFHNFDQAALKLTNEQLKEILNKHKDA